MNKRILLYSLAVSIGAVLTASAAEPAVSVVDRQDQKSSTARSDVARINLGATSVEIVKRNGEKLTFDKATIAKILLADKEAGIEEIRDAESAISVYPRATDDIVNIAGTDGPMSYYLFDINGQLRMTGTCQPDGTQLSLATLNKGLYLLVVGEDTFKIVKK